MDLDLSFITSTPKSAVNHQSINSESIPFEFSTLFEDFTIHQENHIQSQFTMDSISLSKFNGLTHEDPEKFLQEFSSYSTLKQLVNDDGDTLRQVAAFHLHLAGPARVWFSTLPADQKDTFPHLEAAFRAKYVNGEHVMLSVEAEAFNTLTLTAGGSLESFHSMILEKGTRLNRPPQDLLLRFISGLPSQLAFFVRAGNPATLDDALQAAKRGEAHGYRQQEMTASSSPNTQDTQMSAFQEQLAALTNAVTQMSAKESHPRVPGIYAAKSHQPDTRKCFKCGKHGHIAKNCRSPSTSIKCQLCNRYGHSAPQCRQFTTTPTSQTTTSSPIQGN